MNQGAELSGAGDFPDVSEEARAACALLESIASTSRFAGSDSEARARSRCSDWLTENGFTVSDQSFAFSEFPGRYGVPLVALIAAVVLLLTWHAYVRQGGVTPAIIALAIGLSIVAVVGRWLARRATSRLRLMRSNSANLVASRGQPSVWLVAHLDSKSQTIPMIARIGLISLVAAAIAALVTVLLVDWIGGLSRADGSSQSLWSVIPVLCAIGATASIGLALCLTGNKSAGALDNASGVVAVLLAARAVRASADIGVIVTSAEELGLAGARAFVEGNNSPAIAINCDTVDDRGRFVCMVRGRRGTTAAALVRVAERLKVPIRETMVLPGILADSIAFTDAGWDAVTLSRGNISTLARVHTGSDTRERLNGTGIALAARLLAAAAEELA
jgi:Peptidase family M28